MDLETFISRLAPHEKKELTVEVVVEAYKLYVSTKEILEGEELIYSPRKLRGDCIQETVFNFNMFK